MELRGELTGRDGLKRQLRVCCQPQGDLRGLLSGLVQEEDIGEEDEDEEENHVNAKPCGDGPPLKRTKTHS
ncbi:PREDICTED: uncharacterized protein C14orf142 homolog [Gekko japonicus]|uniref:Uncharacterized protein C14orf142 homolog n=1 Tax=Gekko japonicus TaxID=146911 RepID=A0ABM1L2Q4_GEKJA|nr:PREDICTED: uncharacterized protein C14orf142 homolog [Gekko japonicus]